MRRAALYAIASIFLTLAATADVLTPVWIELGPERATLARVIVDQTTDCPQLRADGHALAMHARQPIPDNFKPACEASVPAGTRSLRWGKKQLKLPRTPDRVIVIGDTGCRVKGDALQPCNDPNLWPFLRIADQIAARKPDLIVHVGDFLYRESVCPAVVAGCGGPHGDNWPTWNADFFQPAQAALAAAPWIFARGNHEKKGRSCDGWFYYLDPRPFTGCVAYSEPYVANAGALRIGVLDSAETKDGKDDPNQIAIYAKQLATFSDRVDWLVDHHPFWAYSAYGPDQEISVEPQTLAAAWNAASPKDISLHLSGHVHLFEFVELQTPPVRQIIAGNGGTQLLTGITKEGEATKAGTVAVTGEVNLSFGWTELARAKDGWSLTLRNLEGVPQIECELPAHARSSCKTTQQKQRSSASVK